MSGAFLFSPRGTIDRARFFQTGLALVLCKFAVDATLSLDVFHQPWSPSEYLLPQISLARLQAHPSPFFLGVMLTAAAPFAWTGVCLTTKRLRAIGAPIWLVLFFFAPFLKFFLFALLCLLPSRMQEAALPEPAPDGTGLDRWMPESALGSALLAVVISASLGGGFVALAISRLGYYLGTLFIGAPFCLGFIATLVYNARRARSLAQSIGVALLALLALGIGLLAVAVEGAFCLLMAAPLAICLGIAGAVVAHALTGSIFRRRLESFLSIAALLPILFFAEKQSALPPPVFSVTSETVVAAPPEKVWPHVIRFSEIGPPNEWFFRVGIAYPIRAVIDGAGVGATRHCIFSTGEFVEPITTWEEPARLAFDVTAQPDPLQEFSPYAHLRPPHLGGYFKSERGEFRLISLPGHRTLLRGTTWYSDRIEPQWYWRGWSDFLIHRIHLRVLEHIRQEAETAVAVKPS